MLFFSPIVAAVSVYMGLCYAYFYLLITNLTPTFENVYHFSPSLVGLSYLGLGVGFICGQVVFATLSDRILKKRAAKAKEMKPEFRLPLAVWGGFLVPIAFFWYGWSAEARVHWIMPIIGPTFLGFGNSLIFVRIILHSYDTDRTNELLDVDPSLSHRCFYDLRCFSIGSNHCFTLRHGCCSAISSSKDVCCYGTRLGKFCAGIPRISWYTCSMVALDIWRATEDKQC